MSLSTLPKIKSRLGLQESDVRDDELLAGFLDAVSSRFDLETNRSLAWASAVTEEFCADEENLRVARYPVHPDGVTKWELLSSQAEGWVTQTAAPDYLIRRQSIIALSSAIGTSLEQLRITYSGGYVLPGATVGPGQTALPADLEQACLDQVAYLYQNKDRLGLVSISAEGGAIQQFAQLDLLPPVKAVLKRYERWLP